MEKNVKRRKTLKSLFKFILKIVVLLVVFYILFTYVLGVCRLKGNNMFPSVRDGDLCIFYKLEDYHLNDVVLYNNGSGELKVGRVVAVGDQEVNFPEEGGYTVNGYQPTEEITYQTYKAEESDVKYPLSINENSVFILNDFRSDTKDSREYGEISKTDIQGKLIFVLRRRGF